MKLDNMLNHTKLSVMRSSNAAKYWRGTPLGGGTLLGGFSWRGDSPGGDSPGGGTLLEGGGDSLGGGTPQWTCLGGSCLHHSLLAPCLPQTFDPSRATDFMPTLSTGAIKCCCFAPSGEIFATGSYDHNAIIWDSNTGKEIHMLRGHTHSVETCSFSNNSSWLCTGSWDCSAIIWSVKVKYCLMLFAQLQYT